MQVQQSVNEKIDIFITDKIAQIKCYLSAVMNNTLDFSELDIFIDNTMAEWSLLDVKEETPSSKIEKVFWHVMFELNLHNAKDIKSNCHLRDELTHCIQFFSGNASYPEHCVGWRPLP